MPFKCCVPYCRGNYDKNGPKVSAFAFPSDETARRKWLVAINRDNFTPTKYSKVCELHFQEHEVERFTSLYIEATGETLTAPIKTPRLTVNAVPSLRLSVKSEVKSSKKNIKLRKKRGEKIIVPHEGDLTTPMEVKTCCILKCDNTSNEATIDFFPLLSVPVTPTWINECCKETIPQETDKAWICSAHFIEEAFITSLTGSEVVRTLASDVLPILNLPNAGNQTEDTLSKEVDIKMEDEELFIVHVGDDELVRLREENEQLGRCNEEDQAAINKMESDLLLKKQKLKRITDQIANEPGELDKDKEMELLLKVFSKSQVRVLEGIQKTRWLDDDMAVAYTIRHLSNERTYLYLTRKLNIPLPGMSSIRKWVYRNAI